MKKLNNKGFSLVELIIVIAIMVVLIGLLAPQFIKYVEKSKEATDIQNLDSVITVVQAYLADKPAVEVTITGTKGSAFTATGTGVPATLLTDYGAASSKVTGNWTLGATIAEDGSVTYTLTYPSGTAAKNVYYKIDNGAIVPNDGAAAAGD